MDNKYMRLLGISRRGLAFSSFSELELYRLAGFPRRAVDPASKYNTTKVTASNAGDVQGEQEHC